MTFQRLITACLLLVCVSSAAAQGVTMLNPLAPSYKILDFVYEPPKGDGWRELGRQTDALRLVYAEQPADGQINTRADFTVQSFPVPDPATAPDLATLTRLSMAQRLEEKKLEPGTELVAMSQPNPLAGEIPVIEYQLNLKVGGEEVFEDYFVAIAPDKSQYLAGKLATKDKDFRELPYFKPLADSVTGLKYVAQGSASTAEAAPTGSDSTSNADAAKPTDSAATAPPASK